MTEEKKKTMSVDIKHLEQAFGVDLHEFKPGETYPLSKLMDALHVQPRHGTSKLKPRGDTK